MSRIGFLKPVLYESLLPFLQAGFHTYTITKINVGNKNDIVYRSVSPPGPERL
jgi:hypothetical protein